MGYYQLRPVSKQERVAACIVTITAVIGIVIALLAVTWFAQSQIEDWNRQLMQSAAPAFRDAPR